jgi:hypothetical protein
MKVCQRADPLCLVLQHDTALNLGGLQVIEGAERAIGNALVGERPQPLAGLQLGRIGWQEEQLNTIGDHKVGTGMPTRLIEHQQYPLGGTCSDRTSKVRQGNREHLGIHGGQQEPLGRTRSRMDETVDVEPLEAMLYRDTRPRAFAYPDTTHDRFEADPMLIG